MSRRGAPLAGALLLLPALAQAAAVSPPGVNLRWDQCFGDGGLMYKTFACDTNAGVERLVMSFELAEAKPGVSVIDFVLSVQSASPVLPAWWAYRNPGTCRQAASSLVLVKPSGSPGCTEWASGPVAGGIGAYNMNLAGANQARFICALAVPLTALPDLEPGIEYFLGTINLSHQKTVGTGACGGCDVPVCVTFDYAQLETGVPSETLLLNRGANWSGSRIVGWQGGYVSDYLPAQYHNGVFYGASMDCIPYSVTRARASTWGAVKSLYR